MVRPSRCTPLASLSISLLVQQQLARALGLVVEAVGLAVFRNIGVDQPELAALHRGIGFGEIGAALAQRLHLRALQLDAGLEGVEDLVVDSGRGGCRRRP